MTNKTYCFNQIRVFFKHTDYNGFVHAYNYYEWTSYVRESFFSEKCGSFQAIVDSNVKMMTSKISLRIFDLSIFGDDLEAYFTVTKIKKVSFDVIVKFFNRRLKKTVSETRHTLVFLDGDTQRFSSIPEGIKSAITHYEES